ncbi:unnamed protein product [Caenorhabditis angaria]|uniref:Trifunctional purine biosynthetic protein adenosine-3 n=1 Tax=Caenorhabditis angaria TaxID=860376 RepID=A0A9P1J051_9PELO|nr:unnamed protein product [Caenorhabditis angaria]
MSNILIIGNGGRENALAWKILQSENLGELFVAPGNAGTQGHNIDLDITNFPVISEFCKLHQITLVIIGPEVPLSEGITDFLTAEIESIKIFGPTKTGALLESSKIYSKNFMREFQIPTADFHVIQNQEELDNFFEKENLWGSEIVIKADGLASGKGVIIPDSEAEAKHLATSMLNGTLVGDSGKQLLIERKLEGYEVSALAFVDGVTFSRMPLVRDHKRLLENDLGPNTGGMGVIAPVYVPKSIDSQIDEVFRKTLEGLRKRGINYCGVLYAGFLVTSDDVANLLEFNCRFGDPETQILMRLLETDLLDAMHNCVARKLSQTEITWSNNFGCGVVLATRNYPKSGEIGTEVEYLPENTNSTVIFHAGTQISPSTKKLETSGGRIFCVTSITNTLNDARNIANSAADSIKFRGKQWRKDIGVKNKRNTLSYGASGVNIDEGNQFVEDIKSLVKKTLKPGAGQIGGFGAVLDLADSGFSNDSQLVVGIDGVGTKIEIATELNNFNQIGYDVVGMCVNDVICHCAKPLAFLDYYVCGELNRHQATEVLKSISSACIEAGCSLIGGETAEMPGVYGADQWDLAGCAIACREKSWPALPLSNEIREGDLILGIPSNGLHSNGFSLARKVLKVNNISYSDNVPWEENVKFGEILLRGTRLYVSDILEHLKNGIVKGCAHITGGGLVENATRVLKKSQQVTMEIDLSSWKLPELFNFLATSGPVETSEMIRTFNCGIGMVLVVGSEHLETVSKISDVMKIGKVTNWKGEQIKFRNMESFVDRSGFFVEKKEAGRKVRVAVLISGTGSNMRKLIERAEQTDSNCEVVLVVSNKPDALGLEIARSFNTATRVNPHTSDRISGDLKLVKILQDFGVELICLAGYMRILSGEFVKHFPSRIINIHPSLLPAFKGAHALQDALEFGVKVVGCTSHFVDELIDHGPIIYQKSIEVEESDNIETIRAKIQKAEHILFPNSMIEVAKRILNKEI